VRTCGEPDPDEAEITKFDPKDVLTTEKSAKKLNPLIKPLPSFDEAVLRAEPRLPADRA
jgi:hypothetical protein